MVNRCVLLLMKSFSHLILRAYLRSGIHRQHTEGRDAPSGLESLELISNALQNLSSDRK